MLQARLKSCQGANLFKHLEERAKHPVFQENIQAANTRVGRHHHPTHKQHSSAVVSLLTQPLTKGHLASKHHLSPFTNAVS